MDSADISSSFTPLQKHMFRSTPEPYRDPRVFIFKNTVSYERSLHVPADCVPGARRRVRQVGQQLQVTCPRRNVKSGPAVLISDVDVSTRGDYGEGAPISHWTGPACAFYSYTVSLLI